MDTILNKFDSNETMLLMYLANELPSSARKMVEERLKEDSSLRSQFESLRSSYAYFDTTLTRADEAFKLPSALSPARKFGDAVRRKYTRQTSKDESDNFRWKRMNWILYPVAAAAILTIGMYAWYRVAVEAEDKSMQISNYRPRPAGLQFRGKWFDLNRSPTPGVDIKDADDAQLVAAFDSIISEVPLPSQMELESISYLNEQLEDQLQ